MVLLGRWSRPKTGSSGVCRNCFEAVIRLSAGALIRGPLTCEREWLIERRKHTSRGAGFGWSVFSEEGRMGESESGTSKRGPIQVDQTSNVKVIARDALIIFFALTSIGNVVVVIAGGNSANLMLARIAAVASLVLFGIVGFCVIGYLTPRRRWIHLLRVTACLWVFSGY